MLEVPRLVKGFREFYSGQTFISAGIKARHLFVSFSQINPIQAESPSKLLFSYSSNRGKVFQVFTFLQFSPPKTCMGVTCRITATCPANLILLIRPPNNIRLGVQFKEAGNGTVFSSPLFSLLSWVQITSSEPILTSFAYVFPSVEEIKFHNHTKQQTQLKLRTF